MFLGSVDRLVLVWVSSLSLPIEVLVWESIVKWDGTPDVDAGVGSQPKFLLDVVVLALVEPTKLRVREIARPRKGCSIVLGVVGF